MQNSITLGHSGRLSFHGDTIQYRGRRQATGTNRNGFVTYPCPSQLCGLEQVMLYPKLQFPHLLNENSRPILIALHKEAATQKWIFFSFCSIISLLSKHSLCWTCCDKLIKLMRVHESKKTRKNKKTKKNLGGFPKQGQTGYKSFQGIYIWLRPLTNFWVRFWVSVLKVNEWNINSVNRVEFVSFQGYFHLKLEWSFNVNGWLLIRGINLELGGDCLKVSMCRSTTSAPTYLSRGEANPNGWTPGLACSEFLTLFSLLWNKHVCFGLQLPSLQSCCEKQSGFLL